MTHCICIGLALQGCPYRFWHGVGLTIPSYATTIRFNSTKSFLSQVHQRWLPQVPLSMSHFVSQFVSQCFSVFQNSYQGTSGLCGELRFCLEVICASQHTSNHQRSLAEQCPTQNLYLRCFKSDFDYVKSKFNLLIEQIEKTTSK